MAVNALREEEGDGRICPASYERREKQANRPMSAAVLVHFNSGGSSNTGARKERAGLAKLLLLRKHQRTKSFPQSQTAPVLREG